MLSALLVLDIFVTCLRALALYIQRLLVCHFYPTVWAIKDNIGIHDACNLVHNKEPVNFGADQYDSARIRASAFSLEELVASMQKATRAVTRP